METLKLIHVTCAYITGVGFLLRGLLAFLASDFLSHRAARMLPHVIDTVLLSSALALAYLWSINPLDTPWLEAKIFGLLAYIGFGLLMLRFGRTRARRVLGFVGGLCCYGYIVSVAHSKSPVPWLTFIGG